MSAEDLDQRTLDWIVSEILPHEGDVRAWLRRATPAGLEVGDVVQEAYCRIAYRTNPANLQSGRAYFFTVARNIVREHFRRGRVVQFEPLTEMDISDIVDDRPSAERIFEARQQFGIIWRLMDQLPDRCRRIFLLRKVDGLSQREIARAVGVTENVVEKQIAHGLKLIQRLLADEARTFAGETAHEATHASSRKRKR